MATSRAKPRAASILVVDDEFSLRELLEIALRRAGHDVTSAGTGAEAVRLLSDRHFDLVITDLTMPGVDGMEVLRHAIALDQAPLVIMVTAFATTETAIAAMRLGAYDYLLKPFKVDEIELAVLRALERVDLSTENRRLREELRGVATLDKMVGRSEPMRRVFDLVRKVAPTRTSVLIRGESGTGKELVARALHNLSDRAAGPFVAVNCGAIPADLMESELFGHKHGAFTGASSDREGVFMAAHKGTLFLDEVGELPLALQVKLLRVLQERRIRPVGASAEVDVDTRVVAATNRNLEAAIEAGEFRQDLYFRLNVVQILLPPLRERREDIHLLAERFLTRACKDMGRELTGFSPEALDWFWGHDFPGNVRELENLVERAVALESSTVITTEHLPDQRTSSRSVSDLEAFPEDGIDLDTRLEELERRLVGTALDRSGGVRRHAASLLGVSVRSLRYRLQKLGLGPAGADADSDDEDS